MPDTQMEAERTLAVEPSSPVAPVRREPPMERAESLDIPLVPLPKKGPQQREIVIYPSVPLKKGEGITLHFEGGDSLALQSGHGEGFRGHLVRKHLEKCFAVCRTPGNVPEVGFHGQTVPRRSAALVDEPFWVFPVAWQDRLPRANYPTRSGLHQDLIVPPSDRNPEGRVLRVQLPEAYLTDSNRRFPVLYILDGQNAFDASTSYGGVEWALDDVAQQLEAHGEAPAILVGVDNGEVRRMHEYSFCPPPSKAKAAAEAKSSKTVSLKTPKSEDGGGAQEHLDFLLYEVAPLIRSKFRVKHGAQSLIGSSMGGLFGLWTAITHPGAFRSIGVISPSVWWSNQAVLELELGEGPRPRVWIDMGTREGKTSVQQFYNACRRLKDLGWKEGQDLRPLLVEGGTHHESAWADRAPSILRYLLAE